MSAEVKANIQAELDKLELLVPFPEPSFGHGSDISGDTDLDPTMAEVDPFATLGLAQALVRRLDCPRGQLADDPNYGLGLRQKLNTGVIDADIQSLGGQIRLELTKDDRVDSIVIVVVPSSDTKTLTIRIQVTPIDFNLGPFELILNASSAAILLEEIRALR